MASPMRTPSRLERVVHWFTKEIPPKPYIFEKPPHPSQNPFIYYPRWIVVPFYRWVERQGVHFYNHVLNKTELGLYSKDWNPRVHGIYCHWRSYGPGSLDPRIWNVKLKDLGPWLARRNYGPRALMKEFGRAFSKVRYDYITGPVFSDPIGIFFRVLFATIFLLWLIRQVILDQNDIGRQGLYHW